MSTEPGSTETNGVTQFKDDDEAYLSWLETSLT